MSASADARDERDRTARTAESRRRWALALASATSLMFALDLLVVTTAMPAIRDDLQAPIADLQWTVTGYSVSFVALLMTGAALGDRFGRRRLFTAGLALFVAASAGCALSTSVGALVAFRVLQGLGAALVLPVALALVSTAYPHESRGKAIGILEGVAGLATIAGPMLGGAIAGGIGWHWIFWVNVPIGVVAIGLAFAKLDESYGRDTAFDGPGALLVTGAALGLIWGLVRGNASGWTSAEVLGALAVGGLLALAFVLWERRVRVPLLPMRLWRSPAFSAAGLATFAMFASLYGSVFFMAQFLQFALGYTLVAAGFLLVPWTATLLLVAPAAGALSDRIGQRPIVTGGLALTAAGLAAVAATADPDMSLVPLLAALVVAGIGMSAAMPVIQSALIGGVEASDIGKASGANNLLQELGGAFGVAIVVAAFSSAGSYASSQAFSDGFTTAIAGCAAFALAGAGIALALPGKREVQREAAQAAA